MHFDNNEDFVDLTNKNAYRPEFKTSHYILHFTKTLILQASKYVHQPVFCFLYSRNISVKRLIWFYY